MTLTPDYLLSLSQLSDAEAQYVLSLVHHLQPEDECPVIREDVFSPMRQALQVGSVSTPPTPKVNHPPAH